MTSSLAASWPGASWPCGPTRASGPASPPFATHGHGRPEPGPSPTSDCLTLHFIGSFPDEAIGALEYRLAKVAAPRMALRAHGSELWRGGIAVLRVGPEQGLVALQQALGAELSTLGVALDSHPFAPHVTMARRAMRARPRSDADAAEVVWDARGFALVQSVTGANAAYRVLRSYPSDG